MTEKEFELNYHQDMKTREFHGQHPISYEAWMRLYGYSEIIRKS